ncbi:MAG: PrpF domain-containing protein [Geminicoccaceae bacterium]
MTDLVLDAAGAEPLAVMRRGMPHLSCAMVRSGTSRLVVLRADQLPGDRARHKVILDLMANETMTDGLGGGHYQSNKVAVVGPGDGAHDFTFHFYQVDPKARRLYSRMECSNAASASAVAAMLDDVRPGGAGGSFRTINLATRQQVDLVPPASGWWCGDWGVRFVRLHHLWEHMTETREPFAFDHHGLAVRGDIVQHGNIFVMTALPVDKVDPGLVSALASLGAAYAARVGHPASPSKVLIYRVAGVSDNELECDATCFSEGQQHHSLPGSAAMAMGAFLTANGLLRLPDGAAAAETGFLFHHPSGSMRARVHLVRGSRHWTIDSTSFETPVRLLMHGDIVLR